jgi:hypothetical protein
MNLPNLIGAALCGLLCCVPAPAAELKILLPLNRTAYQTYERIDISVVRSANLALAAGDLVLKVQGEDGSRLGFTFPVAKVDPEEGTARAVEHLHLNGWLLRPGKYTIEANCDGASAGTAIELYGHLRRSSFRLVNWGGRAKGSDQLPEGEDNLGFNLFMGYENDDANLLRAGVDYMRNCTMSGGHQMDLRMECDWSDPFVFRGGTRRVVRQALADRTRGNTIGVHFYDEPGLTWMKDAKGEMTPHGIPAQVRSFEAAFGYPPPEAGKIDPKNPEDVARWKQWARWKLGFMDAAWKDAQAGVRAVDPDYLSVTQSQYGYSAFTDGYYFNVVRSLPVISGHGGYHDFGPGYFNPSQFLEFARARDFRRPNWYLPTWYGNTTADQFRLEQYLSFQTDIQGLMCPPELDPAHPDKVAATQGVVESNKLAGRLGTIFTTMPVTRPPVAMLYSLSQFIHTQTQDRTKYYAHETVHGQKVSFTYLAGKLLQHQFMVVLDEDVLDGTLAANHKALILTSLDYLDPKIIEGIEAFAKDGGLVLMTGDCTVKFAGAVNLGVVPRFPDEAKIAELVKAKKYQEAGALTTMRHSLAVARTLSDAIRPQLEKAGIKPILTSDEPGIVATQQAAGDVEYLFAVNATHDPQGNPMLGVKSTTATIGLDDDGRLVYDAIHGGAVKELEKKGGRLQGHFRFGPGQMRVFARTARPLGGVKAATPMLRRDYTLEQAPLRVSLVAAVLDDKGGLLSGSISLRIRVIDPFGSVRYDLYRATDRGTLNLSLPLAVNDPAGKWKVHISELLGNTEDVTTFTVDAVKTCAQAAGATRRAMSLAPDRDKVFRFFRAHQAVTLVKGAGDYNNAAAERLAKILQPWNVRCTIVAAADVNKPRSLSEEEARTWAGLDYAGSGQIKAGNTNPVSLVGFAVQGPVALLGNAEDNPLIKFLLDHKFLPYRPSKAELPGPGRGMVAWQLDGVGVGQESITLIAYDAKGMSEAVGTMYEMMAGIEPLTPLALPQRNTIVAADRAQTVPEPTVDWSIVLPDRVEGLKVDGGKLTALTHAGTLAEVQAGGKVRAQRVLEGAAYQKSADELQTKPAPAALAEAQKKAGPARLVKFIAANGKLTAVAFWGGMVHVFDRGGALKAARQFPQDTTALAWSGDRLLVGDADGRLTALKFK